MANVTDVGSSRAQRVETSGSLNSPTSDLILLGGASFVLAPILIIVPAARAESTVLALSLAASVILNNPHFLVSYEIFYKDFGRKLSSYSPESRSLPARYAFAGLVVPVILGLFFFGTIVTGSATTLARAYNVMIFVVGWHYVKQGYGMAMLLATRSRRHFDNRERRLLRVNAYAGWIVAWILANRSDQDAYLDLPVEQISIPGWVLAGSVGWLGITSAAMIGVMARRVLERIPTAWTGITIYAISVYAWMVFVRVDPLWLIVVPALHSLQYLYVARTYQTSRAAIRGGRTWRRVFTWSVALGLGAFWVVPLVLDSMTSFDESFGGFAFMFMAWAGINIHHYFMDNVIWRRGNADVSRYLFT